MDAKNGWVEQKINTLLGQNGQFFGFFYSSCEAFTFKKNNFRGFRYKKFLGGSLRRKVWLSWATLLQCDKRGIRARAREGEGKNDKPDGVRWMFGMRGNSYRDNSYLMTIRTDLIEISPHLGKLFSPIVVSWKMFCHIFHPRVQIWFFSCKKSNLQNDTRKWKFGYFTNPFIKPILVIIQGKTQR